MPRSRRKNQDDIPWGESQTEQGTILMRAIEGIDVNGVMRAIAAFSASSGSTLVECRLYRNHTKSKEEEDAHDEALPPLHVLAEAEAKEMKRLKNEAESSATEANLLTVSNSVRMIAQVLLEAGADPASLGDYVTAPFKAVKDGALETARVLLKFIKEKKQQNISGGLASIATTRQNTMYGGNGTDVFWVATRQDNPDMLPMVFDVLKDELGPSENSIGYKQALGRMLELACTFQMFHNIVFLLEKGAPTEGENFEKNEDWCDWPRPLHFAANQGNPDIVQALLDAGASIQTRCVNGLSHPGGPVHFAVVGASKEGVNYVEVMEKRMETVRKLIKAGCDINQPSVMERKTPLEVAIQAGACDMIRFLIVEALCDVHHKTKDYEFLARKHKKKSVARAYERSMEERNQNSGQSRSVRLRRVAGEENDTEAEPIDFPMGGVDWTWDGDETMFPSSVAFHHTLGLYNGEEQLQKLKKLHGSAEQSDSLEEEEEGNNDSTPTNQQALKLANDLADALKNETLKSEGDSKWYPFWILSCGGSSGDEASSNPTSRRSSRRRARSGPIPSDVVKPMIANLLGIPNEDEENYNCKVSVETVDLSQVANVLELGRRSPAVKEFVNTVRRNVAADKVLSIVFQGSVVFPIMIGCTFGQENPFFAGVYAAKVET